MTTLQNIKETLGRKLDPKEETLISEILAKNPHPTYFDLFSSLIPLSNINEKTDIVIQRGKILGPSRIKKDQDAVIIRYSGSCHVYLPIPSLMNA